MFINKCNQALQEIPKYENRKNMHRVMFGKNDKSMKCS